MSVLSWLGYSSGAEREEGSALVAVSVASGVRGLSRASMRNAGRVFLTAGSRV